MSDTLALFPQLLSGFWLTCLLSLVSLIVGLSLAFIMVTGKFLGGKSLNWILNSVITFICGTPLLVQIFLLYYGIAQFEGLKATPFWALFSEPFACAIMALSINTACYTAVLLEGAIATVPENEIAAAYALGMSKWQTLKRIILPQAIKSFLPAYSNEMIIIVKNTSLASTITLMDIMGVTQFLIADSYETLKWYSVAGVLYLIVNGLMMLLYQAVQIYFNRLVPRTS